MRDKLGPTIMASDFGDCFFRGLVGLVCVDWSCLCQRKQIQRPPRDREQGLGTPGPD